MIDFIKYDLPRGIKNLILFFPIIWKFRDWDYSFPLELFRFSLIQLSKCLENGIEVEEERLPKVKNINFAINILQNIIDDNYLELVEKKLGMEYDISYSINNIPKSVEFHNKKIADRADELQKTEWIILKLILFGNKDLKGSDMRGWWD